MSENKQENSSPNMPSKIVGRWTLWYLNNNQRKTWEEMQNIVHSFDMVEDFWSIYNNIRQPSEISQGNDYSMFKRNIRPSWEDAANKNGGRWVLNVPKKYRKSKLDNFWLHTLLCIMGESFEFHEDINGAVVNVRHAGDRIAIWTSDAKKEKPVLEIGLKLKEHLQLDSEFKLYYESHSRDMHKKPHYSYHL